MTNFLTLVSSWNCFHLFGCCHQRRIQGLAFGTIVADPCHYEGPVDFYRGLTYRTNN